MTEQSQPRASDFVGPSGNATPKYETRNPIARHLLRRFLREIDALIRSAGPASILDVGCGEGYVTGRLAAASGASTIGVDLGSEALREHWRSHERDRLTFRAASAYELPFEDRSFDCVCALEVLEHLERPEDALAEMARVSRSALLLSVPREPLWRALHLAAGRDVRHLGNTPGHINHWSSSEFEQLVSRHANIVQRHHPTPWTLLLARPRSGDIRR